MKVTKTPTNLTQRDRKTITSLDDKKFRRNQIANMMGMTPGGVSIAAKQQGLVPRRFPVTLERVEMVNDLYDRGMSQAQIGQQLDITQSQVSRLLKIAAAMNDKAYQIQKDRARGMTTKELCDKYGVGPNTIRYYLNK